jgi:hypothetical protein
MPPTRQPSSSSFPRPKFTLINGPWGTPIHALIEAHRAMAAHSPALTIFIAAVNGWAFPAFGSHLFSGSGIHPRIMLSCTIRSKVVQSNDLTMARTCGSGGKGETGINQKVLTWRRPSVQSTKA